MTQLMPLERAYTYELCKANVKACTPTNNQVDPIAANVIQDVGLALSCALVWYSEKNMVGADAILNNTEKAAIVEFAYAHFPFLNTAWAMDEIIDGKRFEVIDTDMARVMFFERIFAVDAVRAKDSIMRVLKAMFKIYQITKNYEDAVDNEVASALFFGVTIAEFTASIKMLIKAMKMVADEEWIMVEPVD